MFSVFKKFYSIFTESERRGVLLLFLPMTISAIINVMGIAFVAPFIAIVSNPHAIQMHEKIAWLFHEMHFTSTHKFLIFLGVLVLLLLIVGNGIGALTSYLSLRFINMRSFTLSKRLLENYLKQPYVFFLDKNSAVLTKNILSEVDAVVAHVLRYLLDMSAKSVALFFIIALLFAVNWVLAISIIIVLGGAYCGIYASVRKRLGAISHVHTEAKEQRYRITSEALGGIKEIKLQGCEHVFLNSYEKPAKSFAVHAAAGQIIADLPRYALEVIAFGGIILIVLYLLAVQHSFGNIMPLLALYAFAGYRLMPGLQAIFGAMTSIKAHAHALDILYHDLLEKNWSHQLDSIKNTNARISFQNTLQLKNISFTYPESKQAVLSNLNFAITAGESVGIVGETGAGKTTVVDIILGLLQPTVGNIFVDNAEITESNYSAWQKNLGYVPQHIYLADETVARNIAFGVEENEIDYERIEKAAKMASIHDFIVNELPQGYATTVGERGVRLSGGQRQRLGIARALYRDPNMLVFDEATSALDSVTEEKIMREIYHLSRKKTLIIIAHRVTTLMHCDKIIVLQKGVVHDIGTHDELMHRSDIFQRLARAHERTTTTTHERSE